MTPEGRPNTEQWPPIDFLDERIKLSFRIEPEAAKHLPEVSKEDLESGRERYRILLGNFERTAADAATVVIEGLVEMDEGDERFYKEGTREVTNVNIPRMQAFARWVREHIPEFHDFTLIGDIHTHPIKPEAMESGSPWHPSDGDIESIAKSYERGELTPDHPFVFAIAGPDESGETQYGFYRIIKRGDKYLATDLAD
jgi:hypothetical protein